YWRHYHALTERRGVTPETAKTLMRSRTTLIAAVMVDRGEADAMITGLVGRYHKKLGYIRSVLDLDARVARVSATAGVVSDRGLWSVLDAVVQGGPASGELAGSTLQGAYRLKLIGIEHKVAVLSHYNVGCHDDASERKMRQALD